MNKLDMESKDIVKDNLEYIKERFPEAITEEDGELKLNPDSLIQSLSSVIIDDKKEKYELTWPGKKQAIVEGNTRTTKTLRPLKDKSVDFDKTENIYIEGDNLEALKILQESYLNKIKCIYIDPPYNTGNDFIYNDFHRVPLSLNSSEPSDITYHQDDIFITDQNDDNNIWETQPNKGLPKFVDSHKALSDKIIGLYKYMEYLSTNDLWLRVGDGYMLVGKDDNF